MEDCRDFRLRYRDVIEEIHERYPGFWRELQDLAENRDRRRTTTRGATVREFPRTQEQATQASGGRTLGQRLFGVLAPELRQIGTQTGSLATRTVGVQRDASPAPTATTGPIAVGRGRGRGLGDAGPLRRPGSIEAPEETRQPAAREPPRSEERPRRRAFPPGAGVLRPEQPPTRGSSVCWNCKSPDHRYSRCPHPRDRRYCYGCGREGVTMRTCPDCGEEWRDLGPYHPDRGHLGH